MRPFSLFRTLLAGVAIVAIAPVASFGTPMAVAQQPLAPPANLEVIGELRPGTPNIPLLLVVQWDDVFRAERYELGRAERPAPGAEPAFQPLGTFTGQDRRPNGKIGYVDEAGFATAGGDCFRVRAVLGAETSPWTETCIPVPPSSGPPSADPFEFTVEFTPDYEFTILKWTMLAGFKNAPVAIWKGGAFVPVAVFPPLGRTGVAQLVLSQMNGCFRLEITGAPPVEYACQPFPTDLLGPQLPAKLLPLNAAVAVRATGRSEAPVAVLWRASGGPTDLLFRVDRLGASAGAQELHLASVSYHGSDFDRQAQVFLDPAPDSRNPCYRVTAVSTAGETLIGTGCVPPAEPGPPSVGNGLAEAQPRAGSPNSLILTGMLSAVAALAIGGWRAICGPERR